MREMTVREANQNFSQLIAAAERGEVIVITKNGVPVARGAPVLADPEWLAKMARLRASLAAKTATGIRVESITEDDLYGGDT
jgi:prevent-host-death family protein